MLTDGEPANRVLVERKDLSKPSISISLPSTKLPLPALAFCNRRLIDSRTSVIGGLNSLSGCFNSKHQINKNTSINIYRMKGDMGKGKESLYFSWYI